MTFVEFFKETGQDDPFFESLAHILDMPDEFFNIIKQDLYDSIAQDFEGEVFIQELAERSNLSVIEIKQQMEEASVVFEETFASDLVDLPQDRIDFFMSLVRLIKDKINNLPSRKQMQVIVEKVTEDAIIPTYAHETDAGADIYANETIEIMGNTTTLVGTGIKMAIPEGWEIQIRPRSGMSLKTPIRIANCVGTIDSGFRDEVKVPCWNTSPYPYTIKKGERIAQMILAQSPMIVWEEGNVNEVEGDRKGGFGSTGE